MGRDTLSPHGVTFEFATRSDVLIYLPLGTTIQAFCRPRQPIVQQPTVIALIISRFLVVQQARLERSMACWCMRYIVVGHQGFPADVYLYSWYSCIDVSCRVCYVPFLLPGLESSLSRFYYCVLLSHLFIFHPAVDSCKTRFKGGGPAIQYTVATAKETFHPFSA